MEPLVILLCSTAISGIGGTGLGGLIGALLQKDSNRAVSLLLSFAAGVMLSIVCFDLLLSAIQTGASLWMVFLSVWVGIGLVFLLNAWIDRRANPEVAHIDKVHPKTADALDELIHSDHYQAHKKKNDRGWKLFLAGVVMACAIALHNVPEGMTIGASFANAGGTLTGSAWMLAVLIGLHNIPEGMAVSVPLIGGGMTKIRAVLVTAASGAPTVAGAFLGYLVGDLGPVGLAFSLCFASGAMLYVVFGEIVPQAVLLYRSKLPAFSVILGMMVGMLMIYG